jgi:tRNA:m4X modification enzyme
MNAVRGKKRKTREKAVEEERVPGRCALFIQKRGRYCRLAVARGSNYCGEHLNFDPESRVSSTASQRRIPCPLDPHHTVYEDQLQRHLKKCNAAKRGTPVCFSANVNTGIHDYSLSDEEKKPLSAFPQSQLDDVITRVEKIYQGLWT